MSTLGGWPRARARLVLVLGTAVGCVDGGDGRAAGQGELGSIYTLPTHVPDGLELHFGCAGSTDQGHDLTVLGYRGNGGDETGVRMESDLLRVFGHAGPPAEELIGELADEGSRTDVTVRGRPGWTFTVTTAEPVPFPWPAVGWSDGGSRTFMIMGEGLDQGEVLAVAESLQPTPPDAFAEAVQHQDCSPEGSGGG
jgi:hypothetical protein